MSCSLPQLRDHGIEGHTSNVAVACRGYVNSNDQPVRGRSLRHRARGCESEPTLLKLPQISTDSRSRRGLHRSGKGTPDNRRRAAAGKSTEITRDYIVTESRRPQWWPGYGDIEQRRPSLKVVVRSGQRHDFAAAIERHEHHSQHLGQRNRRLGPARLEKRLTAAYILPFHEAKTPRALQEATPLSPSAPKSPTPPEHPAVSSTSKLPVLEVEPSPIDAWARTSAAHREWVKDLLSCAQKERVANKRLAPVLDATTAAEKLVSLHLPDDAIHSLFDKIQSDVANNESSLSTTSASPQNNSPTASSPSSANRSPTKGSLEKLVERFANHAVQEKIVVDNELEVAQQATLCKDYIAEREASRQTRSLHVFRIHSEAGEIDSDRLVAALNSLGYVKPCKEWVEEASIEATQSGLAENRSFNRLHTQTSLPDDEDVSPNYVSASDVARSFLDCQDFIRFVKAYEHRHYSHLQERFERSCPDDQCLLLSKDLETSLIELGMPPMPDALAEIVEDATNNELANVCGCAAEVDTDTMVCCQCGQKRLPHVDQKSGFELPDHISFQFFARICDICARRAGLDRLRYEKFKALFEERSKKSDIQQSATMLYKEGLDTILKLDCTHCVQKDEDDDNTLEELESNGGHFDFGEFIYAMRWHMEAGIERVRDAFTEVDMMTIGALPLESMPALFESLGFATASPNIMQEIARTIGVSKENIDFYGVWRLLSAFNEQCGLSREDVDDARNIFHRCDEDSSGGINGSELRFVFRKMGFPITYEQLQEIRDEFDLDLSGELELPELMRLVARYREREMLMIRKSFNRICREVYTHEHSLSCSISSAGSVPQRASRGPRLSMNIALRGMLQLDSGKKEDKIKLSDVRIVLHSLGYIPSKEQEMALLRNLDYEVEELGFWQVAGLVEHFRGWMKDHFQQNFGFTEAQLDAIRAKFVCYDTDHVGFIKHSKVADVLRDLDPPDMIVDQVARDQHKLLLNIGDVNQKGYLDLPGYIRIRRHYQDKKDYDRLKEETEVMTNLNYTRQQMTELRQIFSMFDADASGELQVNELWFMLKPIFPGIGDMHLEDLRKVLSEVDQDGNRQLNFLEFMEFIRKLQEKDVQGINEKASRISFDLDSQ